MQVGFTFCPRGWMAAQGQILSIAQNTALFSLLGTNYGGNGQTTFALPNFAGRTANLDGQGPGLSPYVIGEQAGAPSTTLTIANMARHDHRAAIQTANAAANSTSANGNALAYSANNSYVSGTVPSGNLMAPGIADSGIAGQSQPVSNRPPYIALNWCIAVEGVFPARN
ncbi:phage tail protein [Sphingopyxis sp. YF1]|nr:phage tail protein [Sphingopyxis sp. YF1]